MLVNSSRSGVPVGLLRTTPAVALPTIQLLTVLDAASPPLLQSAATPATWGEAVDVPLMVLVPPLSHVDVMATPGAYTSTQLP